MASNGEQLRHDDPADLVSDMLKKLSIANEVEKKELLNEARPHLLAPDASKYKRNLENDNLSILFECLNSKDKQVITTTCDILSRVFQFIDATGVIEKYGDFLEKTLHHKDSEVKEVTLVFLNKYLLSKDNREEILLSNQKLMVKASQCLIDNELSVSKESHKFLKTLSKIRCGNNQLYFFKEPIVSSMKEMSNVKNDSLQLRVLELMVEISNISQEHLEKVVKDGFLTGLFNDLKKDEDILVQLNAIEILSNMAETKHGFQYLTSLNILSQMDLRLNEVSSGPMSHFLMPGYIKFFGRLAHQTPKNFHNLYPNFTSILLNMLSNTSDQDQQILALEVFGHISLRTEGKLMLKERPQIQDQFFEVLRQKIFSGTSEAKIRALSVFAEIIRNDDDMISETSEVTENLFDKLNSTGSSMEYVVELARKPFEDVAKEAFHILVAASQYSWGLRKMLNVGGFFEYLLDRSTAGEKESKDRKYYLISSVCSQKEVVNIIPPELLNQMRQYVKQGPYYVETTVEVALDEM